MAQTKYLKRRSGNDGYWGVTFQNCTKQTLGMLDEVTPKAGADLEATNRKPPSRFLPLGQGTGNPRTNLVDATILSHTRTQENTQRILTRN